MQIFDYWLWDNALPKWFCEEQIKNIDWNKKTFGQIKYKNDDIVNEEKRITDVVWLDRYSPIGCIANTYISRANDQAGWNLNLTEFGSIQIGKYSSEKKGFYDWHTDDGMRPNKEGKVRKLSVSILLSDSSSFEGGNFEFKDFETQPELKQGSIIVFPSQLEHRVKPVISGTRYSAVTWAKGPAFV